MSNVIISFKDNDHVIDINKLYKFLREFSSENENIFPNHTAVAIYNDDINFSDDDEKINRKSFNSKIRFRLNENFSLKIFKELLIKIINEKKDANDRKIFDIKCESFYDLEKVFTFKIIDNFIDLGTKR